MTKPIAITRSATIGKIPPPWEKVNRTDGLRLNVPDHNRLAMVRPVSTRNSISGVATSRTNPAQQGAFGGVDVNRDLAAFKPFEQRAELRFSQVPAAVIGQNAHSTRAVERQRSLGFSDGTVDVGQRQRGEKAKAARVRLAERGGVVVAVTRDTPRLGVITKMDAGRRDRQYRRAHPGFVHCRERCFGSPRQYRADAGREHVEPGFGKRFVKRRQEMMVDVDGRGSGRWRIFGADRGSHRQRRGRPGKHASARTNHEPNIQAAIGAIPFILLCRNFIGETGRACNRRARRKHEPER
ncbi:MAG: hypothetical protein ABIT09_03145 [Croceibacterium sp.]